MEFNKATNLLTFFPSEKNMQQKKILLILPCSSTAYLGNYMLARSWRYILKHIQKYRKYIELAAIECIKVNGKPIGINFENENYLTVGKDSYPAWEKFRKDPKYFSELIESICEKFKQIKGKYKEIIVYCNVKAFYLAVKEASKLTNTPIKIVELEPCKPHLSPFTPGSFVWKKNILKLINIIEEVILNDYEKSL